MTPTQREIDTMLAELPECPTIVDRHELHEWYEFRVRNAGQVPLSITAFGSVLTRLPGVSPWNGFVNQEQGVVHGWFIDCRSPQTDGRPEMPR